MDKLIAAFPQNMLDALEIASKAKLKKPENQLLNIVICGMGGSGIGGKIVSEWIQDEAKLPVFILNDYNLPAYVGKNTLVIGSSYSGNTEETLEAVREAKERGSHIIGITSGGEMESFCKENNYDCIVVPGGNPPRSQVAFSIIQLLNIFVGLNIIGSHFLDEIGRAHV